MESREKQTIYISYDGMTDPLGQSQVIPYLKGLAKEGYSIHLISCEKENRFLDGQLTIKRLLEESGIKWYPIKYHKNPPVISTMLDYFKILGTAKRIVKKFPIELVHCRSYISALAGLHLKRNYSIRFVFDMRGFFADERVDGKIWNLKNPLYNLIYKFFKAKELDFLKNADVTVSLTQNAKREILSWSSLKNNPLNISVIPCCADLNHFDPEKIDPNTRISLMHQLNIKADNLVMTYLGSVGTWYMLNEMLDLFSVFLKKNSSAKFLILTADSQDEIIINAKQKNIPVSNLIITKSERALTPTYISLSTFSVFFILPSYSKKASSPTKLAELLSMKIPIICNAGVGDVDQIISSTETGCVINNFTREEYSRAIDWILNENNYNKNMFRTHAQTFGSLEMGVKEYKKIYDSLLRH
jgi:glycosyltransferase involved in cell wall biosynthesis